MFVPNIGTHHVAKAEATGVMQNKACKPNSQAKGNLP